MISFLRSGNEGEQLIVVINLTPVPRHNYRIGVPHSGSYREVLNTDSEIYGGSNVGNGSEPIEAQEWPWMGRSHSLALTLPPLAAVILAPVPAV